MLTDPIGFITKMDPYCKAGWFILFALQRCHMSISNHWWLDYLFNGSFRLIPKKNPGFTLVVLCEGNPSVDSPHKEPVMQITFPCCEAILDSPFYGESKQSIEQIVDCLWKLLQNWTISLQWVFTSIEQILDDSLCIRHCSYGLPIENRMSWTISGLTIFLIFMPYVDLKKNKKKSGFLDSHFCQTVENDRRLCYHKHVSRAWINDYIPQYSVGCNYSSMP